MAGRSFWETLGRGVGRGWQMTKELGSSLSDQAEGKLDLEKAQDALDQQYLALGKLAADALVVEQKEAFAADSAATREVLESIRDGTAEVERLRKEREAEELREAEAREEGPTTPPGEADDAAGRSDAR